MKGILTLSLLVMLIRVSAQNPCADPKNREFDFWLGSWDVFSKKGKLVGKSEISKINGGCAIEENWLSVGNDYTGKSINAYNDEKQKWEQHWFASDGSIKFSGEGTYRDNAMRFVGRDKDAGGAFVTNFIFYNDGPGKMRQYLERSYDGGKSYLPIFELTYVRRVSDQDKIRAVNEKYVSSWLKGDEAAVLSLFTDDAILTPGGTDAKKGKKEIKDFWFPTNGPAARILKFSNEIQSVTIDGDFAMTAQLDHLEWTSTSGGMKITEQSGFAMTVYKKQADGEWRITHQMWMDYKLRSK